MMNKVFGSLALLAGLVASTAAPVRAQTNGLAIPITGSGTAGTLSGTFQLASFAVNNGEVIANGVLTGNVTKGTTLTSILQNVAIPVTLPTAAHATCNILHLVLGPINLNLLGLDLTTNQIVVDLTAESGPGNLLGNLLCQIANLLDNPSGNVLSDIANVLNNILQKLEQGH